jgi:hypothetical protein
MIIVAQFAHLALANSLCFKPPADRTPLSIGLLLDGRLNAGRRLSAFDRIRVVFHFDQLN